MLAIIKRWLTPPVPVADDRLKRQNRKLRRENRALRAAIAAAEGRAAESDRRIADLRDMVDAYAFRVDRRYVFARASETVQPEPVETPAPVPRRRFMREVVAERTAEFSRKVAEMRQREESEIAALRREAAAVMVDDVAEETA